MDLKRSILKNKTNKQLIIFAIIVLSIVVATTVLISVDLNKARKKDMIKLQQTYMDAILKQQITQAQTQDKSQSSENTLSLDEALKKLPKVDKIDEDFK